jgi:hypothetical protein
MGHFLALTDEVLDSNAYRHLSGNSAKVLTAVGRYLTDRNNGEIRFSARRGEDWGISKSQAALALHELVKAGFLRVVQRGCFTSKRQAATYAVTWRPVGNQPATRDYLQIKASPAGRTDGPARGTVARTESERLAA